MPFPGLFTLQLPNFCYKTMSVIHFLKAYNKMYFLSYFIGKALFSQTTFTFRLSKLNKWFLTIFSSQCLISWKRIYLSLFPCQDSRLFKQSGCLQENLDKNSANWGELKVWQGKSKKNSIFFRQNVFFRKLPYFSDPKCYTWLESLGCVWFYDV